MASFSLLSLNENDAILVIVDRLTKRAHFVETKTTITAEDFAHVFLNKYVLYHGIPRDTTSDRDSKFTLRFWQACAKLTGTKLRMAAAYQQRTDGQVEKINAILAAYIRSYVSGFKNDWAAYLALAEFAYNRHYQASIQMTPFLADLGYNPPMPLHNEIPKQPDDNDVSTTFLLHMERIPRDLQVKVRETAQKMKLQLDKGRRDQVFQLGDMVLVATKNLSVENTGALSRKLAPCWIGPYEVIEYSMGVHHTA
ncbi:unnamed protein product [Phytophthora lilii]|uniref:Unnamed protein product n=1 Tax=Phytophthora lilii TaxID=2077276 RepID=A0A9W6WWC8_9STRA|nr:unnamed protein product [Phytophthora lilii]